MAKREWQEIEKQEMTLEEAKAWRASLYKPVAHKLSEKEKREQFRIFWAHERRNYKQPKNLEEVVWLHLKSIKKDNPEDFEAGISNFGLKKIK